MVRLENTDGKIVPDKRPFASIVVHQSLDDPSGNDIFPEIATGAVNARKSPARHASECHVDVLRRR